ncbi:MAG: hypothetical protein KGI62_10095, partial [Xanthomonadaceae bacterium]|nr:hypothetical protein [Xanthomonadaceae bacterium]
VDVERGLDLHDHYYAHHRWFFSLLVMLLLVSIVRVRVLTDTWPESTDMAFELAFAVGSAIGAWTRREGYHKLLAPLAVIGLVAYIFVLFTHLQ